MSMREGDTQIVEMGRWRVRKVPGEWGWVPEEWG